MILRQVRDQFCPRFLHFYLATDHGRSIPLNWGLSDATARFIWNGAFTDEQVANGAEVTRLKMVLAPRY